MKCPRGSPRSRRIPTTSCWSRECRHDVVGWIHFYVRKTLAREGDAEIGGLIVDEPYRGRGIGKLLVEQALEWARKKGCRTVIVRSNVVREDTDQFYKSLGFRQTKTQSVYRRTLARIFHDHL